MSTSENICRQILQEIFLELSLFLRSPKRPPVTVNLLPGRRESGNNSSGGFPRIYRPCVIEPSPLNTAIDPNIGLMKANSSSMGITTSVDIYACTSTSCKYTLPLYVSCSFHLDGLISILWPISKNIPTFFVRKHNLVLTIFCRGNCHNSPPINFRMSFILSVQNLCLPLFPFFL